MAAIMVVVCPAHLYGKTWKAIDAMQRHNEGLLGVPGIWKAGLNGQRRDSGARATFGSKQPGSRGNNRKQASRKLNF
jgi:hypothetical protein